MGPETQDKLRKIASIALCQTALDGERDNAATMFFRILRSNNVSVDAILPMQQVKPQQRTNDQQQKPRPRPTAQRTARPRPSYYNNPYDNPYETARERALRETCGIIERHGCGALSDEMIEQLVNALPKHTNAWTKVYSESVRRESARIRERIRRREEEDKKRAKEYEIWKEEQEMKKKKQESEPWYKFW